MSVVLIAHRIQGPLLDDSHLGFLYLALSRRYVMTGDGQKRFHAWFYSNNRRMFDGTDDGVPHLDYRHLTNQRSNQPRNQTAGT